jgi:hypothetical protein
MQTCERESHRKKWGIYRKIWEYTEKLRTPENHTEKTLKFLKIIEKIFLKL